MVSDRFFEILIILIRGYLDQIDAIQKNIEDLESEIRKRIAPLRKNSAIVMSVPWIGFISAAVILAEIGDCNDFDKPNSLPLGADLFRQFITRHIRTTPVALPSRAQDILGGFLLKLLMSLPEPRVNLSSRVSSSGYRLKKGTNIAAVALARTVLCIVHHLLTVQEIYQEEQHDKDDEVEYLRIPKQIMYLDDMIRYVAKAGYEGRKKTPGSG